MKSEMAQIVGGARDGELVPFQGQEFYEPVAKPLCRYHPDDCLLPQEASYEIRRYRAYRWCDHGRISGRYVADEFAKGLGCP